MEKKKKQQNYKLTTPSCILAGSLENISTLPYNTEVTDPDTGDLEARSITGLKSN